MIVGAFAVLVATADMVNTLVTTTTSTSRWWLSSMLYRRTWTAMRSLALRLPTEAARERLLATYAPLSVLMLLVAWVTQQVIGFGLIWWGLGGIDGANGLFDSIYFSGVVYFTLGFGELVPVANVPRIGALVEALSGVLATALVIGYLPALYSAFSERERKLMTLDAGYEAEANGGGEHVFEGLYEQLQAHGFELVDYETGRSEVLVLRRLFDAQLEFLVDALVAPRGFWGHRIGHQPASMQGLQEPATDLD